MKKRILATLLSLCLVVGLLPVTAMAEETEPASEGDGLSVTVDSFETGNLSTAIQQEAGEVTPSAVGTTTPNAPVLPLNL